MVQAFRRLHDSGRVDGWWLHLVGGCSPEDRAYALAVKREALGLPVHVHLSAPGAVLTDLLGRASIYWHAGGLGEDPETHPDRFEHFGISVVEAMGAGVVPVVFGAAGPAEVVRDGVDGLHFRTLDELEPTAASSPTIRIAGRRSAATPRERTEFAPDAFGRRLDTVVGAVRSADRTS